MSDDNQLRESVQAELSWEPVASDLRTLHARAAASPDVRLAIDMFCYSVFTGGIGENDTEVRAEICARLSWIGIDLDCAANLTAKNPVNGPLSHCAVQVLASKEDAQIARHARALVLAGEEA